MKRISLAAAALVAVFLCPASAAQKTKAQLTTEINTQLPTNGQGQITAAILRQVLQDMVDSDQQILLVNAQTGTSYTFLAGDQGKLVTFNNASSIAVSLPGATGDFGSGWNAIAQNIGAGTVTITAALGTINGSATLTLAPGQIALIVSAGFNVYRAVQYGVMVSVTCGAGLSGGTITTTGTCSITDTLSASGSAGSSSVVPIITYNTRGQLTAVTTATITAGSISAMPDPSGTGIAVKNTSTTAVTRSITATATDITVSNGDGVSGNPTLGLYSILGSTGTVGSGTLTPVLTYDAKGRITAVTSATTAPPFSAVTGQASLTQLPTISNNTILSNISGGSSTPSANSWSAITDTITSTRGAFLTRGASGWTGILCPAGTLMQSGGAGADPSCVTVAGTGTVTSITQGAGLVFSTTPITSTGTISADIATTSNIWSETSNKLLDASGAASALALTTLTDAATIAVDFNTLVNAQVTLGGNRTLGNPTNASGAVGRCGTIYITQDATGSRTLSYSSNWKFAGGTAPTLTTTGGAVDALSYCVRTSTFIAAALNKDFR